MLCLLAVGLTAAAGAEPSAKKNSVHVKTFVNSTVIRSGAMGKQNVLLPSSPMEGMCEQACSANGLGVQPCPNTHTCSSCATDSCDANGCSCDCSCDPAVFHIGGKPTNRVPLCTSNVTQDLTCEPAWNDTDAGGKFGLPDRGRVAILIRGQAFREVGQGSSKFQGASCQESAHERQMQAQKSLQDQIIGPLEERGNKVDLYVIETSNCGHQMMDELIDQYNMGGRIKAYDYETVMQGQAFSTRYALNMFKQHKAVPYVNYSLVMMTRHDVLWRTPITEWKGSVDFRRVNFMSRCEATSSYGEGCVHDMFHMMPGSLFEAFDGAINSEQCFSQWPGMDADYQSGFACLSEVTNRTNSSASVITDWRPERSLREENFDNPIAVLY